MVCVRRGVGLTAQSGQRSEALQRFRAVVGAAWAIAALALCAAAPAAAQENLPAQLGVTVVPPSSPGCPPPSGRVVVSLDGRQLLSAPVVPASAGITALTPAVIARLQALGRPVQISYSGDADYEPSAPVTVTLPADTTVVIVPRCREERPPARPPDDDPTDREDPSDGEDRSDGEDPSDRKDPGGGDRPDRDDPGGGDDSRTPSTPTSPARPARPSDPARPKTRLTSVFLIEILSPRDGARYEVGKAVEANYSCRVAGGGSQIASCEGTVASGRKIATSRAGTRRFTVTAEDDRGRRARKTVTYEVATNGDAEPEQATAATPYDPREHPTRMLGVLLTAFTLLRLAERGGLALARGAGGVADSAGGGASAARASREGAEYTSSDAVFLGAGFGAVALGDRSRTWRWPGTRTLDAISRRLPALLVRRSPLLARVVADGTYLRAILGSSALLGPLAGIALGVVAVRDTGGDALAPAAALTIAIAVLGVLDAAAGFAAVLTFVLGVAAFGSADPTCATIAADRMSAECAMSWTDDVRLMLALAALWFIVPLLAGAARPLRRRPARTLTESWDRGADFVIDSLIGAWAVHTIVASLPAMAGVELPIADDASLIAACVLIALVVRLAFETLAAHLYPKRLDVSEAGELPEPGRFQRFGASIVRTTLFVFFAYIIAGSSWQLWTGAALFLLPQILALYEDRFPHSRALARALPRGLLEIVLTLLVLAALTALLKNAMDVGSRDFLANSFVLLALPGFVLSMLSLFGDQPQDEPAGWGKRLGGIALLAVGVLLVVGA